MEPQEEKDREAIELAVFDIAQSGDLPEQSIELCMERYAEAGTCLRRPLERYADRKEATKDISLGIFRGLHIMGAMRDTKAFKPLLKMLHRPEDDLDEVLGDSVTETLPRIVISTFDGDAESLLDAIADRERGEIVRDSLLRAAAFLAWEGRIDRPRTIAFLEKFGSGDLAAPAEFVWNAWVDAIALLGLRRLEPLVLQVEEDEDEVPDWSGIEDDGEDNAGNQPVINPWRHVGRNERRVSLGNSSTR
jgi:hypothetical protein